MNGCLIRKWAKIQQSYGLDRESEGKIKWAIGLIDKLWEMEYDAWMYMTSVLHDTPLAEVMSSTLCLDWALWNKRRGGFNTLPNTVKSILHNDISTGMGGSVVEKK